MESLSASSSVFRLVFLPLNYAYFYSEKALQPFWMVIHRFHCSQSPDVIEIEQMAFPNGKQVPEDERWVRARRGTDSSFHTDEWMAMGVSDSAGDQESQVQLCPTASASQVHLVLFHHLPTTDAPVVMARKLMHPPHAKNLSFLGSSFSGSSQSFEVCD